MKINQEEIDEGQNDELKVVTTRIPRKIIEYVEAAAKQDHLDKATMYRLLLARAIEHDRLDRAVEHFRTEKVTLLKAAEEAGCPVTIFIDELNRRKVPRGISASDFREELKDLKNIL